MDINLNTWNKSVEGEFEDEQFVPEKCNFVWIENI